MATVHTANGWLSEGQVSDFFHRNMRDEQARRLVALAMYGNSNAQECVAELIAGGR